MPSMKASPDEGPGPDSHHHAAPGHVVEEDHAVGDHQGVVVGQAEDAGAELDVLCALGGGGYEHLRGGNGLPAAAVVLADPCFVIAEPVEPFQELHVALKGEGWVFGGPVEGGHEDAESHAGGQGHGALLSVGVGCIGEYAFWRVGCQLGVLAGWMGDAPGFLFGCRGGVLIVLLGFGLAMEDAQWDKAPVPTRAVFRAPKVGRRAWTVNRDDGPGRSQGEGKRDKM